ncbi:hypothetical protein PV350_44725, partial [Streptomyces sp. PA03-6a]|nr:hypothetical protein [Streptomyces sp. PA03-6a]
MATDAPGATRTADAASRQAEPAPERRRKHHLPRLPPRTIASAAVTTSVGLAVLVALGTLTHQTVLVPPLAATMAIVTATPESPLA